MGGVTLGHCHPNLYGSVAELREVCRREPCAAQARGGQEVVSIAKDVGPNCEAILTRRKSFTSRHFPGGERNLRCRERPKKEIFRQIAMSFEGLEHASNSMGLLLVCDDLRGLVV